MYHVYTCDRFLLIPLMNSERAWAYAMQLKQVLHRHLLISLRKLILRANGQYLKHSLFFFFKDSEQDEENTRLRLHLVRRLKKAARWSKTFLDLCQARGDE